MKKEMVSQMGFCKLSEDEEGNSVWEFSLDSDYSQQNHHIKVTDNK